VALVEHLQAALKLRPGEGPTALRMLTLMVVGMAGAVIGSAGVESLFFSRFGPAFLPYLYVAVGPITFAVMVGMGALLSREPTRYLTLLPLALASAVVTARVALLLDARWFYPVLWLVMMIVWTVQVMGSWGLAGAVSDTRQAKRLFPLYGAGLILGGVAGGLTTGPLAGWLGTENLLFLWAGALIASSFVARSLMRTAGVPPRRKQGRGPGVVGQMAQGFRDVWSWPLLRWMSLGLILFSVLYFTLALLFARAATARFPETDQLAGFLGLFLGAKQGFAVGDRNLVVVGMDFGEGEEPVPVAAVLDERRLEGGLYTGDLGEIDVASELPPGGGLEVELLKPVSVGDDNPRLFRVDGIHQ